MSELQIFNNEEFGSVRTIEIENEPWFVGKDITRALGYGNGKSLNNAISNHVDDDDKGVTEIVTPGGKQQMTIVNESGLYALIFGSKLESAKRFKRWVTAEVLPSIRKNGSYSVRPMTEYQKIAMKTKVENTKIRKAQILERLAKVYEGTTYQQVLNSYATKELTGEHILPLPELKEKVYTAKEVGEKLGISANKVGILTNRYGLKNDHYGKWFHDKAKGYNKEVSSFRYYETIIPKLESIIKTA